MDAMTSDSAADVADLTFEQARDELVRVVAELDLIASRHRGGRRGGWGR